MNADAMTTSTESAPLLRPWGAMSPLVARMIAARPGLAARLMLAPRRAIHAVGAFVLAHPDEAPGHLAADVAERDARELLTMTLGRTHPRLFRALDRCGATVWPLARYHDLVEVLHGPFGGALLERDDIVPDLLRELLAAQNDPVAVAAARACMAERDLLPNLRRTLACLRALGLAQDVERLPKGSGRPAMARRLARDFARAASPVPPFAAPPGWRHIGTVGEMIAVGRALGNCLGRLREATHYMPRLLKADLVMFASGDPVIGLAAVEQAAPGVWFIGEVHLRLGVKASIAARERFAADLHETMRAAGHHLLSGDPWASFRAVVDDGVMDLWALNAAED